MDSDLQYTCPVVSKEIDTAANAGVDAFGTLATSLACARCGYNLRGLPAAGNCPECGTLIQKSLRGDLLQFSDPDWVHRLARGTNWIAASVLIGFLSLAASIALARYVQAQHAVNMLINVLSCGVSLVGSWLLTTPEPRVQNQSVWTIRAVIRFESVFDFLMSPAWEEVGRYVGSAKPALDLFSLALSTLGLCLLFVYIRRLALRIPDDRLAKRTKLVMWGVLIGMLLLGSGTWIPIAGPNVPMAAVYAGVACLGLPVLFVFGLWSLLLMLRYRKALYAAAESARVAWDSSGDVCDSST